MIRALEILPVGTPEYEQGYSLDRLRELLQVPLPALEDQQGTHLYESLRALFVLVDQGYEPRQAEGIRFNALRADLFAPAATQLINQVGLGNQALQQVLARLLLSKEQRGKDRGFISYAELGINQLGAVYEGLMSYTGFFAEDYLYEVAKDGKIDKGSWVVPKGRAAGIDPKDFVREEDPTTGESKPVVYPPGSFVFRLAGRERQQSASYYTPEVLTQFTVSQGLEELIKPDTTAEEILGFKVCELALGSGAFAIETTRQLAERYLRRRQEELGETIDPSDYPRELQKAKAHIALHNVYGVDLNETAVELAEISLWLDTMVAGLDAPWFGLHLRPGNSLIGARHAFYTREDLKKRAWLKKTPREISLEVTAARLDAEKRDAEEKGARDDQNAGNQAPASESELMYGRFGDDQPGGDPLDGLIHHFLLPAAGWGSGAAAKTGKELEPERAKALRDWARAVKLQPTAKQARTLQMLARRVEHLWQFALQRMRIAEGQTGRRVDVWGRESAPRQQTVHREEIERALADEDGAYQRLRAVMDAWSALWFWPLTEQQTRVETPQGVLIVKPPSFDQWLEALTLLLGTEGKSAPKGATQLNAGVTWSELGEVERLDFGFAAADGAQKVREKHPWLEVCQRVAKQQRFFHWQLDFASVFAEGGFDFQIGNPPWVRPRGDEDALLAEGDPWWQLATRPTQKVRRARREETLQLPGIRDLVVEEMSSVVSQAAFLSAAANYPHLRRLQPDTYRCFMEQTWRNASPDGVSALIHPETHFTDDKADALREATYRHLRRHWQFINEKMLFPENDDKMTFGVHVYGAPLREPRFLQAVSLYHPDTVTGSLRHSGEGEEPGIKNREGNWDTAPHRDRIITVDQDVMRMWQKVLGGEGTIEATPMVYAVNRSLQQTLEQMARADRVGATGPKFSSGWHETGGRRDGLFEIAWGAPDSWDDVILQGPHLHVGNPAYKYPNATMRHNQDWHPVDLETLAPDAVPVTSYKPAATKEIYDAAYTDWGEGGVVDPARNHYRVALRAMAANTGERTLIAAIIPPGSAHIHGILSVGFEENRDLLDGVGYTASLLSDLVVRSSPKSGIFPGIVGRLPINTAHPLLPYLRLRALRLNTLTRAYADLWNETWDDKFQTDQWAGGRPRANREPLAPKREQWTPDSPLRLAEDRRQALVEIDALVAVMLGVSADQLATVYRTAFPVLYGYDKNRDHYDQKGRLVPQEVLKARQKTGDQAAAEDLTATNPSGNSYKYVPPFVTLDREADLRHAHAHFTARLDDLEDPQGNEQDGGAAYHSKQSNVQERGMSDG